VSRGATRCTKWEVLDLIARRKLVATDVGDFGTTTDKTGSRRYEGTVETQLQPRGAWTNHDKHAVSWD